MTTKRPLSMVTDSADEFISTSYDLALAIGESGAADPLHLLLLIPLGPELECSSTCSQE